jgi:hypothetical protein
MENKIEIQLSKIKIFILFLIAVIFVILGTLVLINPEQFVSRLFRNPGTLRIFGFLTVVFFGMCLIFLFKKLFDSKTGLIIDESGITDNSNSTSVGLIEWLDITGIRTIQIASTKILIIDTNKSEKYIKRATNAISKRAMKANHRMYGSPLSIISSSLKIKYGDLEQLIKMEFSKRNL